MGYTAGLTSPGSRERHFTVAEISEMWTLSQDVVRRLFEFEAGVLVIGEDGRRRKRRRYRTLRIPQSVMERVHRRLCNPEPIAAARVRAI
jgi:hypothetical protein